MMNCHSIGLMLLSSAIVFGYAYCLDLFQALQVHFRLPPYNFSTMEFNLMYFFTYLPIFILNIPIGTIIDRSPVTLSLFVLLIMSFVSQLGLTLMVQTQITGYIVIMYVMRSLFGIAGEGIFTVQGLIITKYCKNNFEMVISVALSLPFLFDAINSVVTTRVYDATGKMVYPWYIGTAVAFSCIVSGWILYKNYIAKKSKSNQSLLEVEALSEDQSQAEQAVEQGFNIRQLRSFSSTFWVLIASTFFTEVSFGSFNDNLNDLLVKRFNIPYTDAGTLLIIPYSCLTLFSIIFSLIMSKWPKTRRSIYVSSCFLYLAGQIALYLLPQTQTPTYAYYIVIAIFCTTLSFFISIYYTAILGAIPYLVEERSVGTAFGVIGCVIGLSQCITPFMAIAAIDSDSDLSISYKTLNLLFIFLSFIPFCLSVYIKCGPFEEVDSKFQDKQDPTRKIQKDSIVSE